MEEILLLQETMTRS